jgi:hypothetical protein
MEQFETEQEVAEHLVKVGDGVESLDTDFEHWIITNQKYDEWNQEAPMYTYDLCDLPSIKEKVDAIIAANKAEKERQNKLELERQKKRAEEKKKKDAEAAEKKDQAEYARLRKKYED